MKTMTGVLHGTYVAESDKVMKFARIRQRRRQFPTIVMFLLCSASLCTAQTESGVESGMASPNRPAYTPMTDGDRLHWYIQGLASPLSLVSSAAGAGIGQWRDRPKEWPQGAEGYGFRYASSFATHIVRGALLLGASSALHEDYRYLRSGQPGSGSRVRYAVASTFRSRRDDGSRRLSLSRIGAFAGAALISRLWQPKSTRSVRSAMLSTGTSIGVSAGFNVAREFWPGK